MTNTMHINFYFRPSTVDDTIGSIYVQVTINKERVVLGAVTSVSGLRLPKVMMIKAKHWDAKEQRVRRVSDQALVINKAIGKCEEKLNKLYAQHEGFDITMNGRQLKLLFFGETRVRPTLPLLMDAFIKDRTDKRGNENTIATYQFKFRPFTAFLTKFNYLNLPAEEFTPELLENYKTYLMVDRKNSDRTADKSRQVVKTILLWAAGTGLIKINPLLNTRIRVDKTPNLECLSQEEVQIVRSAPLMPQLRAIADCFIFACYTGLAYQDLKDLSPENLQVKEGKRCIVGNRNKTGTEYIVPVTPIVNELMVKYNGVKLPLPSNQRYNTYLKDIMFLLGIKKRITTHTARKTFADWCINEIMMSDEATIVAMGQKDPKELTPYRKIKSKRLISEFPKDLLME
ncbi:site-specific integrase [Spirosoma foliorum]|uniref:Phage integrase SAM-like domain-containing protein n=1 Tax=Spirosoma foliorum TaxID=2710596 RepID=A0A7G5H2E7_9BACT|nr:site-specific integrase [Spirosoma foliorum]QMW05289.1 phage integrase SAM-like domain-containing protein [Spirosoma foliorum]